MLKPVSDFFENKKTCFSFEILPPLKGSSIEKVYNIVDNLIEFDPICINITTHHSENVFKETEDGSFFKYNIRKRPGSVAIAAALQHKYKVNSVPHIICNGFSREETEYALIDLDFLNIHNLLLLRGDIKKLDENQLICNRNEYSSDLQNQVNNFNDGVSIDNSRFESPIHKFDYGMACYPELHVESPNLLSELYYLKCKQDNGAKYFITQMFFDNSKFFEFVHMCRKHGIIIPIIPGIKPIGSLKQLSLLPKTFRVSIPRELELELIKCKNDFDVQEVGTEWCINQCKELKAEEVPGIHFYTMLAMESVKKVAKNIF